MATGYRVKIRFTAFDVEYFKYCEYDWISMRSGNSTHGKFCGSKKGVHRVPNDQLISPTNEVTLIFHSDYSNEEVYKGFRAHYSAVGKYIFLSYHIFFITWFTLTSRRSVADNFD